MGFIARLKQFARAARHGIDLSDVKVDLGGGDIITAEHFEGAGGDSHPLEGDYVATVGIPRSGGQVVVGYVDPLYTPKALPGEKIIYARDDDGVLIVEVHLKNTGEAVIRNENGMFTLRPDGSQRGEHGANSYELKPDGSFRAENPNGSHELLADGSIKGENGSGSFELQSAGDFLVNTVRIDTDGNVFAKSFVAPSMIANGKELAEHTHGGVETGGGSTGPNQ